MKACNLEIAFSIDRVSTAILEISFNLYWNEDYLPVFTE